ncbi:Triadin [Ophiophagus hannah]|uniref:Triadin n=1 Tax=Ophiophagus hannah TaxID=8665 RepID=V8NSZ4_OPHHA|nr:Triadin [Ophiophagus hannah]
MTEIAAEGPVSTTTVIDNKNGTVPVPHMKMSKRSVSEDFATTFSSPAAWLLVVALVVTWSAVAIVMFDLVDYRTLAGQSINKLTTDPFRIMHGAVEESTNSIYGFLSLLSDLIFEDEDENGKGEREPYLKVKEEIQPPVKKKEIQIDKTEKIEKVEKKPSPKEIQRDKGREREEKIEKKLPLKEIHKEKPEKYEKPKKVEKTKKLEKVEKPQKRELTKVIHKEKSERHEKVEKKEKPEKQSKDEQPGKMEKKEKAIVSSKEKTAKQEKKKAVPFPKDIFNAIWQGFVKKVTFEPKTFMLHADKKSIQVEEKLKKDVKEKKPEAKAPERLKTKEIKAPEVTPKAKEKKETALAVREKIDHKVRKASTLLLVGQGTKLLNLQKNNQRLSNMRKKKYGYHVSHSRSHLVPHVSHMPMTLA